MWICTNHEYTKETLMFHPFITHRYKKTNKISQLIPNMMDYFKDYKLLNVGLTLLAMDLQNTVIQCHWGHYSPLLDLPQRIGCLPFCWGHSSGPSQPFLQTWCPSCFCVPFWSLLQKIHIFMHYLWSYISCINYLWSYILSICNKIIQNSVFDEHVECSVAVSHYQRRTE